jgi:hypothetical protein
MSEDFLLSNQNGGGFRTELNLILAEILRTGRGNSRPTTVADGRLWVDDNTPSSTVWTLYMVDGADDIVIGTINTTAHTFAPAGYAILDEDNMASNSATALATQQSIKAYVDASVPSVPTLAHNSYTPTATNVSNVASSSPYETRYLRIGDIISLSGAVDVTPAGTGNCQLGISIPVASAFTTLVQASGTIVASNNDRGYVAADATNDRLQLQWSASSTSVTTLWWNAIYRII